MVIAKNRRDFDELSALEQTICIVGHVFAVNDGNPHVVGGLGSSQEGNIVVELLDLILGLVAETGETVLACTTETGSELAILVVCFLDRHRRGKGRRLGCNTVEETEIAATVSSQVQGNTFSTGAAASKYDVLGVTTEFGYILLDPFHNLALVAQTVVGSNIVSIVNETVWSYTVVETDDDEVIVGSLDQARCIGVDIGVDVEATALDVQPYREIGVGSCVAWSLYVYE